jgi:hypothetical protein
MQATCPHCGIVTPVTLTPGGFSYGAGRSETSGCPMIKQRLNTNGGRTDDMDCEHMARSAQMVAHKMRGGRV